MPSQMLGTGNELRLGFSKPLGVCTYSHLSNQQRACLFFSLKMAAFWQREEEFILE